MEPDAIEAVLQGLQEYPYGWQCELPAPARFFGKPVGLRVDTREVPADGPPPPLDSTEAGLVRLILSGLPGVLAEAERQYATYNADFPDLIERAHGPHVWVSRDMLAGERPGNWAFVVGIVDAPDWCIQTEFNGLEFKEIWSGD